MSIVSYCESCVRRKKQPSRLRGQTARYILGGDGYCSPKHEVFRPHCVENSLYIIERMCQLLTTTSPMLEPQPPKLYHISHTKDRWYCGTRDKRIL